MKTLDLKTWKRKEHFKFFSKYDEPYFGIVSEVDCTKAYELSKEQQHSFFASYLHKSTLAVNQVEEFRYRIKNGEVVVFDTIHAGATIARKDETFGFTFIPFHEDFYRFNGGLREEIRRVENSGGLSAVGDTMRADMINYSTFPWRSFSGLTHPRNFGTEHSVPRITFGRASMRGDRKMLPVSVDVHHGLMDGLHIAKYLQVFEELLGK